MPVPRLTIGVVAAGVLLFGVSGVAGGASAPRGAATAGTTLGTTTQPSGSTADSCDSGAVFGQLSDDPSLRYIVPAAGGQITQWSTNTTGDTPGTPLALVVLRPKGGTVDTVVATDLESVPTPLPSSGVATFQLAQPIAVNAGDTFGLYSSDPSGGAVCFWEGGSVPAGESLWAAATSGVPPQGQSLDYGGDVSPPGFTLNLAVNLLQQEDAGVTTAAAPANAAAERPALLSSTVTNAGPGEDPITFTDHVPAGLTIDSVAAGNGSCATSGQTVTCTITGLAAGKTAPVDIVVTPTAAGSYTNSVSVSDPLTDTVAANNTATATLIVTTPAPTPACVVPKLKNTPAGVAKTVLADLGCTSKSSKAHSKSVRKGNVIKTQPGAGTQPFGTTVKLVVSSGPKKHKHKHHKVKHRHR